MSLIYQWTAPTDGAPEKGFSSWQGTHISYSGGAAESGAGSSQLASHTGRQVDVVETSRGCTYDCSFCSIVQMRGRNFYTYSFQRVLDDIRDARDHGARTIFLWWTTTLR